MFDDRSFFLHIGAMKTGTTALQTSVFPRCKELSYFGKPFAPLSRAIRAVTTLGVDEWPGAFPSVTADLAEAFQACGSRVLISEEEFSAGGEADSPADRSIIASRLHGLFPSATIVLVIRNQLEALQSLYAYVMGLTCRYLPFNDWLNHHRGREATGRGLDVFDYFSLVQTYLEHFPRDRVKVLFYEDMATRYDAFARALAEVLGLNADTLVGIPIERHNVRPSLRKVRAVQLGRRNPWIERALARLPNRVVDRVGSFLDGGRPVDVQYTEENRAFVTQRYAASNRSLAAFLQVDLSQKRYPCQ